MLLSYIAFKNKWTEPFIAFSFFSRWKRIYCLIVFFYILHRSILCVSMIRGVNFQLWILSANSEQNPSARSPPTFQVNIDLFTVMDTQDNLHVLFEDQQRPLTKVISDLYQLREESIYYIFQPKFLCTVTPAFQVNIDLYVRMGTLCTLQMPLDL